MSGVANNIHDAKEISMPNSSLTCPASIIVGGVPIKVAKPPIVPA